MRGSRNLVTQRMASSRASGSSGGLKFVGITVGALAAGAAGVAGYASYDNEFRKTLENSIPGSRNVLNYTIGVEEPPAPRLKDLRPLQFSTDPKIPPRPFEPKPVEQPKEKAAMMKKEMIINEISVDDNDKSVDKIEKKSGEKTENPYIGAKTPVNPQEKNENLTESLKKHLADAEKATKTATGAKLETIRAIEHHIQTIREAIEGGKNGDWDAVTVAHLKAKRLAENDLLAEKKARNAVAELVTEANLGGQGETTQLNPLVPISKATASKLANELDEMISNVKHVDSERIFVHDYSDRVAESRKKFQLELKAVHPNLNYEEGMKLKKADLQTILAHAHLRIDQLSQKLIDSKLSEEKRVQSIISKKKQDILEKLRLEAKATVIPELDKKKLDEELARATAEIQKKYDEKLKEVVRTQKQLYDIEHAKDVDDAVQKERNLHSSAVGKALAQLEGIEKALAGHLQMDIENRKSKQMWLATQNLKETVVFGNRASCCMEGRRAPLGDQIKTLLSCGGSTDEFVKTVDASMAKTSKIRGEYTEEDLNTRFNKVCRIGRRVAYVNEGGALSHLYSWLKSSLTIQLTPKKGANESLTPSDENNFTLLTRAEQLWKSGKKADAIRVLQMTDGATRRVAADFIQDSRRQQEALLLSRLLLAHAALTSIRSTY